MLDLRLDHIDDQDVRSALYNIQEFLRGQKLLNFQWEFFTVVFTAAASEFVFTHNLGFTPKDYHITSFSNGASGYIDIDTADGTTVEITTTGPTTMRFLLGNLDTTSQA